jgi:hypothetical protein
MLLEMPIHALKKVIVKISKIHSLLIYYQIIHYFVHEDHLENEDKTYKKIVILIILNKVSILK